jgi:type IV pilus assembly protein PilQ
MKFPMITLAALAFSQHVPAITSVAVLPVSGHADVVITADGAPAEIQDFTLDSPRRVVVDLKGVTLNSTIPSYDKVNRGGITNVRVSQYRTSTARVVIELDGVHPYEVKRSGKEVRVIITGGSADFTAWRAVASSAGDDAVSAENEAQAPTRSRATVSPSIQQSSQPKITVTYQDADIRDVIAAFATFAGRTIVTGRDVNGTVTAEIRNQPWDVALRAILQGQGLAATEDPASGIITVDSYGNIQAKQALEPLVTQLIPINYAKADSLVPVITKLLAKDCTTSAASSGQGGAAGGQGQTSCLTRGAVASNSATNTIIITETPSRIGDIINYVQNLDVRTPQVAIKAKIIFVNRTDIENLGLSYDLGTRNQFFNQLVKRTDPSTLEPIDTNGDGVNDALGGGTAFTADQILLGGSALSAIANANNRVTSPALSLVYSAALGKYSLTTFLDALQEVRLADLQAEPSIVTVDNKQAQIQVGQDVPVRVIDVSTSGAGGATGNNVPRATVSFRPVGIILNVTPHITNNRQILLDVHAENSDAQIASSDVGYVFNKQSADNRLLVNDGETAVIGGLTVTQVSQNKTGIPLLVDLPIIGRLFGTTNRSEEKRDLLILITPHVIDAGERVGTRGQ